MDEKKRIEAVQAVNGLLMNVAIRALMRSHPDPVALRAAWDQSIAELGVAMLAGYAGSMANTSVLAEEFRQQKEAMEAYLPPAG